MGFFADVLNAFFLLWIVVAVVSVIAVIQINNAGLEFPLDILFVGQDSTGIITILIVSIILAMIFYYASVFAHAEVHLHLQH